MFSESDLPSQVFQLEPSTDQFEDCKVPLVKNRQSGEIEIGTSGKPLRFFSFLPRYINRNVVGGLLELWFRLDPRLEVRDIVDRMGAFTHHRAQLPVPSNNALNMRRIRFREAVNTLAYLNGRQCPTRTEVDTFKNITREQLLLNTSMEVDLAHNRLLKPVLANGKVRGYIDSGLPLDYFLRVFSDANAIPSQRQIVTLKLRVRLQELAIAKGLGHEPQNYEGLEINDEPTWFHDRKKLTAEEKRGRPVFELDGKSHSEWIQGVISAYPEATRSTIRRRMNNRSNATDKGQSKKTKKIKSSVEAARSQPIQYWPQVIEDEQNWDPDSDDVPKSTRKYRDLRSRKCPRNQETDNDGGGKTQQAERKDGKPPTKRSRTSSSQPPASAPARTQLVLDPFDRRYSDAGYATADTPNMRVESSTGWDGMDSSSQQTLWVSWQTAPCTATQAQAGWPMVNSTTPYLPQYQSPPHSEPRIQTPYRYDYACGSGTEDLIYPQQIQWIPQFTHPPPRPQHPPSFQSVPMTNGVRLYDNTIYTDFRLTTVNSPSMDSSLRFLQTIAPQEHNNFAAASAIRATITAADHQAHNSLPVDGAADVPLPSPFPPLRTSFPLHLDLDLDTFSRRRDDDLDTSQLATLDVNPGQSVADDVYPHFNYRYGSELGGNSVYPPLDLDDDYCNGGGEKICHSD